MKLLLQTLVITSSAALAAIPAPLLAQEPAANPPLEAVPEPPPIPEDVKSGETLEPEVTIIESEEERIEQYSTNGQVYMVKITPKSGPPYYLIDMDGDGRLETRQRGTDADVVVPQWVIFSW
jgi:hypothetical protein